VTLAELNRCDLVQFVEAVGGAFSGSPWIAERAWRKRPFTSFDELSTRLIQEVQAAPESEQLAVLRSAPTPEGVSKQLLDSYRKKFGFPFVYSVKDADPAAITEAVNRRLKSAPDLEFQVALGHTFRIARFRLEDIVR